jgi:hypothetical protein
VVSGWSARRGVHSRFLSRFFLVLPFLRPVLMSLLTLQRSVLSFASPSSRSAGRRKSSEKNKKRELLSEAALSSAKQLLFLRLSSSSTRPSFLFERTVAALVAKKQKAARKHRRRPWLGKEKSTLLEQYGGNARQSLHWLVVNDLEEFPCP